MIISIHSLLVTVPKSLPKELCPLSMGFQGTWIEAKQSCKMFSLEGHILAWNLFQAELTRNLAHLHFGWRWCCPSGSQWQMNRKFQRCVIRMFQIAPGAAWSQPLSVETQRCEAQCNHCLLLSKQCAWIGWGETFPGRQQKPDPFGHLELHRRKHLWMYCREQFFWQSLC